MSRVHLRRSEQASDTSTTEAKTERGFASGGGDQGQLLASALSWNMIFSATNGVVLLAGSPVLDGWFGVSAWLLGGTGAGLLLFAGSLLWLLAGTRHLAWGARAVIAADLGWVAGASVLLLAFPDLLSLAGRYRMTVDVDSYPAYYRMLLHRLEQTWSVEPVPEGTRLALRFDGGVKLGIVGRVTAGLLGNQRRLEAILDAYGRETAERAQAQEP